MRLRVPVQQRQQQQRAAPAHQRMDLYAVAGVDGVANEVREQGSLVHDPGAPVADAISQPCAAASAAFKVLLGRITALTLLLSAR